MSYTAETCDHVSCGGGLDAIVRVRLYPLQFGAAAVTAEHEEALDDWSVDEVGDGLVDIESIMDTVFGFGDLPADPVG